MIFPAFKMVTKNHSIFLAITRASVAIQMTIIFVTSRQTLER